jgi:hypothetical protein
VTAALRLASGLLAAVLLLAATSGCATRQVVVPTETPPFTFAGGAVPSK